MFKIRQSTGGMTSLNINGTELQPSGTNESHVEVYIMYALGLQGAVSAAQRGRSGVPHRDLDRRPAELQELGQPHLDASFRHQDGELGTVDVHGGQQRYQRLPRLPVESDQQPDDNVLSYDCVEMY